MDLNHGIKSRALAISRISSAMQKCRLDQDCGHWERPSLTSNTTWLLLPEDQEIQGMHGALAIGAINMMVAVVKHPSWGLEVRGKRTNSTSAGIGELSIVGASRTTSA